MSQNLYQHNGQTFAVIDGELYLKLEQQPVFAIYHNADEATAPKKRGRKPKEIAGGGDNEQEPKRKNFTPEEERNIIELYNRKEPIKTIARLFKRDPAAMSSYLWRLKKAGKLHN